MANMHAAVVEKFGAPLVLREMPIPTPGSGQIVIKTEACGVCHTDLHAAHGDWPLKPTLPFIPGHEAIGLVTAVGAGVTIVKEGDRVGVPWLFSACGHCEYCLSVGTVCPEAQFGGYTKNGGFAEYVLADPDYVAHVPDGLKAVDAAPLICAGITTYKGIKQTSAMPGQWIAISGVGGLVHLAIQYAKAMGLPVCAIDIDDGKLAHAERVGADLVFNAKTGDPAANLKKKPEAGAHGVLITASSLIAFKQGVGMTRKRGTCVLVGLPPGHFPVLLLLCRGDDEQLARQALEQEAFRHGPDARRAGAESHGGRKRPLERPRRPRSGRPERSAAELSRQVEAARRESARNSDQGPARPAPARARGAGWPRPSARSRPSSSCRISRPRPASRSRG